MYTERRERGREGGREGVGWRWGKEGEREWEREENPKPGQSDTKPKKKQSFTVCKNKVSIQSQREGGVHWLGGEGPWVVGDLSESPYTQAPLLYPWGEEAFMNLNPDCLSSLTAFHCSSPTCPQGPTGKLEQPLLKQLLKNTDFHLLRNSPEGCLVLVL